MRPWPPRPLNVAGLEHWTFKKVITLERGQERGPRSNTGDVPTWTVVAGPGRRPRERPDPPAPSGLPDSGTRASESPPAARVSGFAPGADRPLQRASQGCCLSPGRGASNAVLRGEARSLRGPKEVPVANPSPLPRPVPAPAPQDQPPPPPGRVGRPAAPAAPAIHILLLHAAERPSLAAPGLFQL